jgi:hypothetical protein
MVAVTERGLTEMRSTESGAQLAGLMNLVTFGRAVTNMLQNIRSIDADLFDLWYAPFQEEMTSDPLLRYFYLLRSEILKEGPPRPIRGFYVKGPFSLSTADGPPGTKGVSVTPIGLVYHVEFPDGTKESYRAPFPPEAKARATWHMPNTPTMHLSRPIENDEIVPLAEMYVAYLTKLVHLAETYFLAEGEQ